MMQPGAANTRSQTTDSTLLGVKFDPGNGMWSASFTNRNGECIKLGQWSTEVSAATAHDKEARKTHAAVNFTDEEVQEQLRTRIAASGQVAANPGEIATMEGAEKRARGMKWSQKQALKTSSTPDRPATREELAAAVEAEQQLVALHKAVKQSPLLFDSVQTYRARRSGQRTTRDKVCMVVDCDSLGNGVIALCIKHSKQIPAGQTAVAMHMSQHPAGQTVVVKQSPMLVKPEQTYRIRPNGKRDRLCMTAGCDALGRGAIALCIKHSKQIPAEDNRWKPQQWRSYDEAITFVHAQGIKSQSQWEAWRKTDARPADIPTNPERVYKGMSWGHWLGTQGHIVRRGRGKKSSGKGEKDGKKKDSSKKEKNDSKGRGRSSKSTRGADGDSGGGAAAKDGDAASSKDTPSPASSSASKSRGSSSKAADKERGSAERSEKADGAKGGGKDADTGGTSASILHSLKGRAGYLGVGGFKALHSTHFYGQEPVCSARGPPGNVSCAPVFKSCLYIDTRDSKS